MLIFLLLAACTSSKDDLECVSLFQGTEDSGGPDAGFAYCYEVGAISDGAVDRVEAIACPETVRDFVEACTTSDEGAECSVDADCGEAGYCGVDFYGGCNCYSPCSTDEECGDGACICAAINYSPGGSSHSTGALGECFPGDCRTGDDCESGECGVSVDFCGWAAEGLYCRTDEDLCRTGADCDYDEDCRYDGGRWSCSATATCD